MIEIKNKTIFITGGASGIGLSTALEFLSKNANVVVYSIDIPDSPEIKKIKSSDKAMLIKGDIRKASEVKKAMNLAVKKFGSLDILINNAAVAQNKEFSKTTHKDWSFVFDINVKGTLTVTQEAIKIMKARHSPGMIINIASGAGEYGIKNLSLYSMTKAMIINFSQSLADELKNNQIKVITIAPGSTSTLMFKKLFPKDKAYYSPRQIAEVIYKTAAEEIKPDNRLIVDVFHHIK